MAYEGMSVDNGYASFTFMRRLSLLENAAPRASLPTGIAVKMSHRKKLK
jgi:hypothetical protein